jgi:hypothetical protein
VFQSHWESVLKPREIHSKLATLETAGRKVGALLFKDGAEHGLKAADLSASAFDFSTFMRERQEWFETVRDVQRFGKFIEAGCNIPILEIVKSAPFEVLANIIQLQGLKVSEKAGGGDAAYARPLCLLMQGPTFGVADVDAPSICPWDCCSLGIKAVARCIRSSPF